MPTATMNVNFVKQAPSWTADVGAAFTPVLGMSTSNPSLTRLKRNRSRRWKRCPSIKMQGLMVKQEFLTVAQRPE